MAEFSIELRTKKIKSPVPVYIRVAHRGKLCYIRSEYLLGKSGAKECINRRGTISLVITDSRILQKCDILVKKYWRKMQEYNISDLTCTELVQLIQEGSTSSISFTKYAELFIERMKDENRDHSAQNYTCALRSFQGHIGYKDISFSAITVRMLNGWIESLRHTARAKNMYPTYLKKVFNSGIEHYNDYDLGIRRIENDPFNHINIPQEDTPTKRGESSNVIRSFFAATPVTLTFQNRASRELIGFDVARLIFGLAGINTADLYDLAKESFDGHILRYNRKKTREHRKDHAYIEISVPENILYLFEKYKGKKKLFIFSETYSMEDYFAKITSKGIKDICNRIGIPIMTAYSFRHSWASIAVNECMASIDDVAFALNHVSAHGVTWRYIKEDYTRIDTLNEKVQDCVFTRKDSI